MVVATVIAYVVAAIVFVLISYGVKSIFKSIKEALAQN